jgi:flagellar biosynthesis protein FliQ
MGAGFQKTGAHADSSGVSTLSTVNTITNETLTYAPAVLAGVQVAETTGASGSSKLQAVVNGVLAASQAGEAVPNATVAGISALVNLVVSIFNATGIFSHKAAAPSA